MRTGNTIAAIATAASNSGIGIIRISGEESLNIIKKIFKPHNKKDISKCKSHTVHYGTIIDGKEVVDEVLVLIMRAPNTYTREDVVEIDCHGGYLVVNKVLELVLKNGAYPAEAGEFTKRAFLNGRIDLAQAEAVADIINAKNDFALKSSVSQLKGFVSDKIKEVRAVILHNIAFIESALDDPEHISLDGYSDTLMKEIEEIASSISKLISDSKNGRVLSEGIKTVILGKPNAGKSSLLNTLVGTDRAIVTDIAGTTRDTLEEQINLGGLSLRLVDTAGIRKTGDIVEKIGVDKALENAKTADLIIYVVDATKELDDNDLQIIEFIKDKKSVILLNKSDLNCVVENSDINKITGKDAIEISAKKNTGIDELENEVKRMYANKEIDFNDQVFITNARHQALLNEAYDSICQVKQSIINDMPEDFFTIDLMNAYEALGLVIGEAIEDDLVNEIFSKFCMGK